MRRLAAIWAIAIAVILSTGSPGWAHGGAVVLKGNVGPYWVQATESVVDVRGVSALLYSVTIRDRSTELPVDDASVTVTLSAGSLKEGPVEAARLGNQYSVLIADPGVREWSIVAAIEGPAGSATLAAMVDGTSYPAPPRLDVWGTVAALLFAFAYAAPKLPQYRRSARWKAATGWVMGVGLVGLALWVPPRLAPPASIPGGLDIRALPLVAAAPLLAIGLRPWIEPSRRAGSAVAAPWLAAIGLAIGSRLPPMADLQLRYVSLHLALRLAFALALTVGSASWFANRMRSSREDAAP